MVGAALVFESIETFLLVSVEPLVAGFAANGEALAEFGHGEEAILLGSEKPEPFVHRVGDFPGHDVPPQN